MNYSFTDDQMNMIESDKKHLLIYGEAGCGKSPIITKRIKHIIDKIKVNPSHILICVHNLKEASELKRMLLKEAIQEVVVKTYEALALEVLMEDGYLYPKYLSKEKRHEILETITKEITVTEKKYLQYLRQPQVFPNYKSKIEAQYKMYLKDHNLISSEDLFSQALHMIKDREMILPYKHLIMDNTQYVVGELKSFINAIINDKMFVFATGSINQLLLDINPEHTLFYDLFHDERFDKLKLFINYKNNLSVIKTADFIRYNNQTETDRVLYVKQDHARPDIKWFEKESDLLVYMNKHISDELVKNQLEDFLVIVNSKEEEQIVRDTLSQNFITECIGGRETPSDALCDFLMNASFDESKSIKSQLDEYENYFKDFPMDLNRYATKNALIDLYTTLIMIPREYQKTTGVQIAYPYMMHGMNSKYIIIPFLHSLLNDKKQFNRRLLYTLIHSAKEYVSIYDLKDKADTHLHQELDEIKDQWLKIRLKKAEQSQKMETQSSLTSDDKQMFKRIEEGFNQVPKLKNELLYLIKLTKEFDQHMNKNHKNYDIYMQAFRYFIQHTLKITFDVISDTKKDRIASYLSGGSAGTIDLEKHMELFYRKGLNRCFTAAEIKSIHDVYRYLSATHHKSDDFIKSKKDLKSAAYNIKVFRDLSNHIKIKSYVAVIKFFDSLELEDKKWQLIEQSIQ